MYSIVLCALVGLVISGVGSLLGAWGWIGGSFVALILFVASWILVNRRLAKVLRPSMELVRKQAELGQIDGARQSLTALLPMARWVPMLRGQLESQLGILALHSGDEKMALEHLSRSSRRGVEGQLMLASMHYRKKAPEEALKVMAAAAPLHRKHSLFQNVYAYLLQKEGRLDEAIARLNLLVRKSSEDDIAKDNLKRLQNRQRMDLKVFGNEWFALGLERPPTSMGQMRTARAGFRQPSKKKQQPRKKRSR